MKKDATKTRSDAAAWDSLTLLTKAQCYAEEMLTFDRDDWRFAFWSSLTLEVLARSALSKVSPVLLADTDSWHNLYAALGYEPKISKFTPKSITTGEVFNRLSSIQPTFNNELREFCLAHAGRRNAELHSGETPFASIKTLAWLPNFFKACDVLLASMGLSLAYLFGDEQAEDAPKLISAASDTAAKAVDGDIKAHKLVWERKTEEERGALAKAAESWATRYNGHVVPCPACACKALLTGEAFSAPKRTIVDDDIVEKQQYQPSRFECVACGLKISGLSYLNACGLAEFYTKTSTYSAAEYYATEIEVGEDHGWSEDYND